MAALAALIPVAAFSQGSPDQETAGEDFSFSEDDFPVDEGEIQETAVHGRRVYPTDDTTGFAATVEVEDSTEELTSVSEVLSQQGGVQVRSTGGLGSSSALSIRGSTPGHLPVYLDGVLLNSGGGASFDLGALSIDSLSKIEIYRGCTPPHLSDAGLGGAISLVTRSFDEPLSEVAVSYGSFNTGRITAITGRRIGEVSALAALFAEGSEGDFTYLNRNGTLYDESDDVFQRRENNHHLSYGALVKLDWDALGWDWTLANDLGAKIQGIPGVESIPTETASLRTFRDTVSARVSRPIGPGVSVTVRADYTHREEDYSDVDNEVGIGAARILTDEEAGGGGIGLELGPWRFAKATVNLDGRIERLDQENLLTDETEPTKRRFVTSGVAALELSPFSRLLVIPAYRLEHQVASFSPDGSGASTSDIHHQPSLGYRLELTPSLFARANLARAVRAPTMNELFGERGTVTSNPSLKAEKALNGDAGLTYFLEDRGVLDSGRFELVGFASKVDDLIAYVQNSQSTVRAENVSKAHIFGTEAAATTAFADLLEVHVNYTYLLGINKSDRPYYRGKRLPGRPAHELYASLTAKQSFGRWSARLWTDLDYQGGNYLDQANVREDVLGRLFWGLGARAELRKPAVGLTVEVKNLLDTTTITDEEGRDRPVRDYRAFPLPGRSIFATVNWRIQ